MRLYVEVRESASLIGRVWIKISEIVPEEKGTILVSLFTEVR